MSELAPVEATSAPATTDSSPSPAPTNDAPKEVRVVDEKEIAEREEAKLNESLKKVFREAKRERDDSGRFAGKAPSETDAQKALNAEQPESKETPAEKPVVKDHTPEAKDETKAAQPEKPAPPKVEAPSHWSDEAKAKFATLQPDVQQAVLDAGLKERQALSKIGEELKQWKRYEPLGRMLNDHKELFSSKGLTYEQGISQLLGAQRALETDPYTAMNKLAQAYGVDLWELAGRSANQPTVNPEVESLKQQIAQLQVHLANRDHRELNDRYQGFAKHVDDFAKDKPDFEELADEIVAEVMTLKQTHPQMSEQQRLQEAYDRARWANPNTRNKLLEQQTRDAEAKRIAEAQKAAEAAKHAGSINVTGAARSNAVPADMDDLLRQAYRKSRAA